MKFKVNCKFDLNLGILPHTSKIFSFEIGIKKIAVAFVVVVEIKLI